MAERERLVASQPSSLSSGSRNKLFSKTLKLYPAEKEAFVGLICNLQLSKLPTLLGEDFSFLIGKARF